MWSLFKKRDKDLTDIPAVTDFSFLGCDMHSHLVPGIDDGAQTPEDSLELIRAFKDKGYKKLIITPHVHGDFYDNTREKLTTHFAALQQLITDHHIDIKLGISAEYYLDNYFQTQVLPYGLLPFGDNHVLVEVSMAGWPRNFSDLIFSVQSVGYKPILAHPERYQFENDTKIFHDLKNRGILMQMNILSVLGYYGKGVKLMAEKMMEEKLYDFCGSDVHHIRHVRNMDKLISENQPVIKKMYLYGFKNDTLL